MITKKFPNGAVLCYLIRDGQVCLAKKKSGIGAGYLNGYGGGMRSYEKPKDTGIRELREESRVRANAEAMVKVGQLEVFHFKKPVKNPSGQALPIAIYMVWKWKGEPEETTEMGPPQWFPLQQIPLKSLMPADCDFLPRLLRAEKLEIQTFYDEGVKNVVQPTKITPVESFAGNHCVPFAQKDDIVIHGLLAGLPLCGFTQEQPYRWPKKDCWVQVNDARINCIECQRRSHLIPRRELAA